MNIKWSNEAKLSYEKEIDYLINTWEFKIVEDFEGRTNTLIDLLKTNKKMCPISKKYGLRKCVIHPNVSLIYKIKNSKTIELVTFISNRKDHKF